MESFLFFLENKKPIAFSKQNNPLPLYRKKGDNDSVAQLVEQMTLNHWVEGSSPSGVTWIDFRVVKLVFIKSNNHLKTP